MGYSVSFPLQAYCFRPILSFNSIAIINSAQGGKTIAYLPALLSRLLTEKEGEKEEKGDKVDTNKECCNGPVAIIIAKTSWEVETIYTLCTKFVPNSQLNIVKAFDKWKQEENEVQLINGCDLLISTPFCFTRLANEKTINKNKIMHLVLHNLDLMFADCKNELENVIQVCTYGIENKEDNPQIIITSQSWQQHLHHFLKLTCCPSIAIGNYLEAAIYSNVTFKVECGAKDETLIECLTAHNYFMKKVMIVANVQADIERLQYLLTRHKIAYSFIETNVGKQKLDSFVKHWKSLQPGRCVVFLALDSSLRHIQVDCVQMLIHYTPPIKWNHFTYRFKTCVGSCKQYLNISTGNIEIKEPPMTMILLDDTNSIEIPRIIKFLVDRRFINHLPDEVKSLVDVR
jgi:superfamily II DNA/RNA helicase